MYLGNKLMFNLCALLKRILLTIFFSSIFLLVLVIELALSPNSNEIHIYDTTSWEKLFVLTEHDLVVSALDWSSVNNKIVSCSHDRNAFVWTYEPASSDEEAKWKPALVILRIDRAAMDVKWAWDGLRFAVGSGSKCIPMCTYDASNDWWVSKMIKKKIKSTVICVAFHPTNGQLLATGCADFKCRIFSTYSADVDGDAASDVNAGPFGKPVEFGEVYTELSTTAWINAIAWSPSGNTLAYASHDSAIHFATFPAGSDPVVQTIRFGDMPLRSLIFVAEGAVVAGGHDFNPRLYAKEGSTWAFSKKLDEKKVEKSAATSAISAARALFQNKTSRGQEAKAETDSLWTKHENAITSLYSACPSGGDGVLTKISSSSLDGRVVV